MMEMAKPAIGPAIKALADQATNGAEE